MTEDGLDLQCVLPIRHLRKNDHTATTSSDSIEFGSEISEVIDMNWREEEAHSMIIVCMAGKRYSSIKNKSIELFFHVACHTLTRINGELAGDPLDLKMLAFTQYELYEPADSEQANFDTLFPTIVRPINAPTNHESRPGHLSGSVSSLIAGVCQ